MPRTCPSCGAEPVADATHCHRCGTKLDADDWPSGDDAATSDTGGDWRTAAKDAGVGATAPTPPTPRAPGAKDPVGPPTSDATMWAMAAHASALVAALLSVGSLIFLGPLVVWLVKKDEDPFVERHAREALNFNLLMLGLVIVGVVGGIVLTIVTFGLGVIPVAFGAFVVGVFWLVTTITATIKAANGDEYSYPFNISLVK